MDTPATILPGNMSGRIPLRSDNQHNTITESRFDNV